MESRKFIAAVADLIPRLKSVSAEDPRREALQTEVRELFAKMTNPTLPSAYKLRDAALSNGFQVSNMTRDRIADGENMHPWV